MEAPPEILIQEALRTSKLVESKGRAGNVEGEEIQPQWLFGLR